MSPVSIPNQCCVSGTIHTSKKPTGREEKLHGLDVYIAESPTFSSSSGPKGIVVVIPDIFGWTLVNSRILADGFAKEGGYLVFLPDFMDGNVFPADLIINIEALQAKGLLASLKRLYHYAYIIYRGLPFLRKDKADVVRPRVFRFFQGLRDTYPGIPVGAAGYCWGGKWVLELCSLPYPAAAVNISSNSTSTSNANTTSTSKSTSHSSSSGPETTTTTTIPLVNCGYTAHPSRFTFPTAFTGLNIPVSVAASGYDAQLPPRQTEMLGKIFEEKNKERDVVEEDDAAGEGPGEDNLEEGGKDSVGQESGNQSGKADGKKGRVEDGRKKSNCPFEVVVYEGTTHGFAVRGPETDRGSGEMGEKGREAFLQALRWFEKWF